MDIIRKGVLEGCDISVCLVGSDIAAFRCILSWNNSMHPEIIPSSALLSPTSFFSTILYLLSFFPILFSFLAVFPLAKMIFKRSSSNISFPFSIIFFVSSIIRLTDHHSGINSSWLHWETRRAVWWTMWEFNAKWILCLFKGLRTGEERARLTLSST